MIILYAGRKTDFSKFWLALGSAWIAWYMFTEQKSEWFLQLKNHVILVRFLGLLLLGGVFCFFILLGMVLYGMIPKASKNLDYIILLGAKVNGEIPSRILMARIKRAAQYLKENKETKIIVSGGQGPDEGISEALAMKRALIMEGIAENRIIFEDRSVNTKENIEFSYHLIENKEASIALVTSDFHIFRAMAIAKKQGIHQIQGIPAPVDTIVILHYVVRECFALVKEKFVKNI
ncbi:MAG TPA: YdcF family protein [Candidatus Merdenecus merdavium]|nr:YdcF family protein [Candidatus Merdenecus merdavium]